MAEVKGENILGRATPDAARAMQEAIAASGGSEVFFAGSFDASGKVARVRVCARGHASAVPAILEGLLAREVVIHNHPGGNLTPSDADIGMAGMYSAHGHGVYIIDNEATQVYVVIEPFIQKEAVTLEAEELREVFSPAGAFARGLQGYEVRPQQTQMMESVAGAFNRNGIAVIEAPTGVGKTLAYLVPAVLWAVRNKERVVISTRTINLQEQLIEKDIPLVRRILDVPFRACLVKGRSNYLCLRKMERNRSEAQLFDDEDTRDQIDSLGDWAASTKDGSKADLPFVPAREVWDRVCSEADTCSLGRCPDKQRCFLGKARREVATADVLVVNHHMLFSDLALRMEAGDFNAQAVLPNYRRVIFDEAHSVEDSATEYFGATASRGASLATLGQFYRLERGRERGLLPTIKARLMKDCPQISVNDFEKFQDSIDTHLLPEVSIARNALDEAFDALRTLAADRCRQIGRDVKWRLTEAELEEPELRTLHGEKILPAVDAVQRLMQHGNSLLARLEKIRPSDEENRPPLEDEAVQLRAYLRRMERTANALAEATSESLAPNTVRWIEIDGRNDKMIRVVRCPLEVGEAMANWVYEHLKSVVLTSATLSVQQDFKYLYQRIGLDRIDPGRVQALTLDSPFDFETQALLGLPSDFPGPERPEFNDACAEYIEEVLKITRGRAFVLFTSYAALEAAFRKLEAPLRREGITLLKQGAATRTQLLDRFRSDTASVLLGTDSFWEGVDVPGEALECVILPRLPFRVPTEPVLAARSEAIQRRGGNPFMEYSVPQAVIKFRQGFGRLIRRRSDRGVILVLDQRVVSKFYGKIFLRSLPAIRTIKGPQRGVALAIQQFLDTSTEKIVP